MTDIELKPGLDEDLDASSNRDVHLSREFVENVHDAVRENNEQAVHELVDTLHAADLADLLEGLSSGYRKSIIRMLGDTLDPEVLHELEGLAQDEIYDSISNEQIALAVSDMDTDDAVYVLEELDEEDQKEVLNALHADDRAAIIEGLAYPEESAGRLMQRDLVALPEYWTVGQAIDFLRDANENIADTFYEIFIVDPGYKPIGTMHLSTLLRAHRPKKLGDLMKREQHLINAMDDQEDVAYYFTKYHLISAAVINDTGRLVGMITVDDVVDVIGDEAKEDIMALAGVRESGLNESIIDMTKSRFVWLFVSLLTAVLASTVIALFDASIEQMVSLAVLMPIVASMGGNAGTQTMTVAVRAIATKELNTNNTWRTLNREFRVSVLNGSMLAIVAGIVAWLWFDNATLGLVFASAMIFNLIVAGLSGLLVPITLDRIGVDPAISSSVFVTTITDVVGFFVFLGLAAAIIL